MDKHEAREKLRLFRPGTDDANDPEMAEALTCVKQDEELAQWFDNHCKVYLAMRQKLKQIPVPDDLKRTILQEDAVRRGKIVVLRKAILPLAAAAMIMLLGVVLWSALKGAGRESFRDCRERMVLSSQRGYQMVANTNLADIHTSLLARACPDYKLTRPLAKLPAEGYAALEWHNRKVSMVCLKDERDKQLFLFVMNAAEMRDTPPAGQTEFAKIHRLNSASWTADGKIYILAGPQENAQLKQYLD